MITLEEFLQTPEARELVIEMDNDMRDYGRIMLGTTERTREAMAAFGRKAIDRHFNVGKLDA